MSDEGAGVMAKKEPENCRHEFEASERGTYVYCAKCGGGRECLGWREACVRLAKKRHAQKEQT